MSEFNIFGIVFNTTCKRIGRKLVTLSLKITANLARHHQAWDWCEDSKIFEISVLNTSKFLRIMEDIPSGPGKDFVEHFFNTPMQV